MSATGLEVFDTTVQKTNVWLKDLMEVMGEIGARLITPCARSYTRCATGLQSRKRPNSERNWPS